MASSNELLPPALAPVIKFRPEQGFMLADWMFLTENTSSFNNVIRDAYMRIGMTINLNSGSSGSSIKQLLALLAMVITANSESILDTASSMYWELNEILKG
jgi:hypothetical protein